MEKFDEVIVEKIGELADTKDFTEELDIETPIYEPYDDDEGGGACRIHVEQESHRSKERQGPILDTRTYQVRFPDGVEAEYAANAIAENMWAQCDPDGNQHVLLESIVDHTKDGHAVNKVDQMVVVNGRSSMKTTTKGWMLCMQWKDGTTTWEHLSKLKESNSVEIAEYAVANEIHLEPAFEWWVPFTLKKRDRIISALTPDASIKKLGTLYGWDDAIKKEMKAVQVAFKKLDDGERAPPTYQQIQCHMIFDVKMDTFQRKA
eukprot:scaffold1663_cov37-Attheya_sp.AAC.1